MGIHEMFGRQAEKLQEAIEFHRATIQLLADLRDGKVQPEQIVIDAGGWTLKEAGE